MTAQSAPTQSPGLRLRAARPRVRAVALATALWLFGLSTTILLIGMWGRSVAADEMTLESSARAVLESEVVSERIEEWLEAGVMVGAETAPPEVGAVLTTIQSQPVVQAAIHRVVDEAVHAALAPPEDQSVFDLRASLTPLIPVFIQELEAQGIEVDDEAVEDGVLATTEILVGDSGGDAVTGAATRAAGTLTTVMVIGLGAMVMAGTAAVALSDERWRQLRTLFIRVAVSAVTFAIILRVGSWAVDPYGGRSPLAAGSAVLLGSHGSTLLAVALVAAAGAAVASFFVVRRRRTRVV